MSDWTENLSKEDQEHWKKAQELIAANEAMRRKEEEKIQVQEKKPEFKSAHQVRVERAREKDPISPF